MLRAILVRSQRRQNTDLQADTRVWCAKRANLVRDVRENLMVGVAGRQDVAASRRPCSPH